MGLNAWLLVVSRSHEPPGRTCVANTWLPQSSGVSGGRVHLAAMTTCNQPTNSNGLRALQPAEIAHCKAETTHTIHTPDVSLYMVPCRRVDSPPSQWYGPLNPNPKP